MLSALEPVGSVPDLTRLPHGGIGAALYNVERSLGSILSFSFFITKQMKTDLHAGQLSGTLPILYVFLARSGKTIRDVTPIALDDKGAAYFANENPGPNATRGVRILFAGSDGVEKTLYYFSTDLSNSGVKVSGFLKFCATLAPGNSLIKSASYLLHSGNFTTVRDFILANSATIIQDDSGIPLANYDPKKWRFFPFGRYARTDRRISRTDISRPTPNCSGERSRSISASAIAGARMNRTCCCRSSCRRMVQAAGRRDVIGGAAARPRAEARRTAASAAGRWRAGARFPLVLALAPHSGAADCGKAFFYGALTPRQRAEPPRQIPSRARRSRQRHVVDARSAPGLAAQQPRQRHPAAGPQSETLDRLVAIDRTGRQMAAVVTDQRRQRVPVDPDQRRGRNCAAGVEPFRRRPNNALNASWAIGLSLSDGLPGSLAWNRTGYYGYAIESHPSKYRTCSVAVQQMLLDAFVT